MNKTELIKLFKNHSGDKLELFKSLSDTDKLQIICNLISELEPKLNSPKNNKIFDRISYYKQSKELSTLIEKAMFEEI